ncbi:folylpolyglutamate synthase/dihydrofolate synthase family protein [Desulfococcaceae bacterium HSG9]|nr:folylpolyglutamate synthase/dihydrofolate synthase family protein [Desulfococcaceae bacterium HSG9]
MSKNSYTDCLKAMFGLRRFGIKLGLDTIQNILSELGNPQNRFHSVHIAGTNGKGSVASTLASILQTAGFTVGLYTSPHLVRFNERIRINNRNISESLTVELYKAVKSVHQGEREPTFFEFTTAMAFYAFGDADVDWAIIETGMGGRLDATNIIQPALSIITNISLEHQTYLGDTLDDIAREKGGIIKAGIPVISGVKQNVAQSVIKGLADAKAAPLFQMGKDFRVERNPHQSQTFTYHGMDNVWHDMRTALHGRFQIDNAALALAACEILNRDHESLLPAHIKKGMEQTQWPGRLEMIPGKPMVILDGAHNLAAAHTLADYLQTEIKPRKITLVTGILDDKPYSEMLKALLDVCDSVILTQPEINRSLPPETLAEIARKMITDVSVIPEVGQAIQYAVKMTNPADVVCIAGSLYLVGDAKKALEL